MYNYHLVEDHLQWLVHDSNPMDDAIIRALAKPDSLEKVIAAEGDKMDLQFEEIENV